MLDELQCSSMDGDDFERDDMEANARAVVPSDYSVHQFLAHDDGREGSDDSGYSDGGAPVRNCKEQSSTGQRRSF